MDTVLTGLNFEICLAYLDDIIVFSRDLKSHLERLETLLETLGFSATQDWPNSHTEFLYSQIVNKNKVALNI